MQETRSCRGGSPRCSRERLHRTSASRPGSRHDPDDARRCARRRRATAITMITIIIMPPPGTIQGGALLRVTVAERMSTFGSPPYKRSSYVEPARTSGSVVVPEAPAPISTSGAPFTATVTRPWSSESRFHDTLALPAPHPPGTGFGVAVRNERERTAAAFSGESGSRGAAAEPEALALTEAEARRAFEAAEYRVNSYVRVSSSQLMTSAPTGPRPRTSGGLPLAETLRMPSERSPVVHVIL